MCGQDGVQTPPEQYVGGYSSSHFMNSWVCAAIFSSDLKVSPWKAPKKPQIQDDLSQR